MSHESIARRKKDLAIIHAGKKKLGLNDDTYRDFLESLTGHRSAADLKGRERATVIAQMEKLGGLTAPRSRLTIKPSDDKAGLVAKVEAQLFSLDKGLDYAESILKQMFGEMAPARLEWATPEQLRKVVAALYVQQKRKGIAYQKPKKGTRHAD